MDEVGRAVKLLVVHEVNYLEKIIYEFQILPEILSMLGHEVTIVDYDDSWQNSSNGSRAGLRTRVHTGVHRAYPEASVTVRRPGMIRLPIVSRVSGAITSGWEVHEFLRKYSADAVLLYGLPTVGVQTLLSARQYDVPVFFRSIDVLNRLVPWRSLSAITRVLERYIYRNVEAIFTVTLQLKNHVLSYNVPESRVRVLPSGVDTAMFSPGPRNNDLLRQWGIGPGDPVILFMGTIYKFSGLDRVIREFPQVLARHRNAKLLIVGRGEDEDRLKQLSIQGGLPSHVIFGGLQSYSALVDIIRSSDICINPFELNGITRDILPTKLFQYLACGKPVIATELPGTLPFLGGAEHGMVYSSLGSFTGAICDLLDAPTRRDELGRMGIVVTRAKYEWKQIAETLVSWIEEMKACASPSR
jgi:glycosyltransferase involved in cell wall biosynthesis